MTYTYDAASRTTGVRNAKADGTVIAGYVYTRDAVGNPTGVSLSDGNLVSFCYDDAYRLTREQRSGAAAYDITYSYDSTGNRTGKLSGGVTTTYTVDPADRLTLEDAGGTLTTYSFDAAGNNTVVNAAGALTTYTWDLTNRMTGLADASGVTTLVYDATGLRRSKQDSAGTTGFLWDGQTLLLEADAGGTTQAHYAVAPGGYGPTVAQRRGTVSSLYHPTDLGTIENLTDASGRVTDSYAFTAFGVPVATSGTTTNPHRYVGALGYYTDPTTGLSYVRARYLRPTTGSWLSVDPVASEPRYRYVRGRATRVTDASGLKCLQSAVAPAPIPGIYPMPTAEDGAQAADVYQGCLGICAVGIREGMDEEMGEPPSVQDVFVRLQQVLVACQEACAGGLDTRRCRRCIRRELRESDLPELPVSLPEVQCCMAGCRAAVQVYPPPSEGVGVPWPWACDPKPQNEPACRWCCSKEMWECLCNAGMEINTDTLTDPWGAVGTDVVALTECYAAQYQCEMDCDEYN